MSRQIANAGSSALEEVQRARQPWIVAVVALIALAAWVSLLVSLFRSEGVPVWAMALVAAVFGVGLPWFLLSLELRTTVDGSGLHVRFRPPIGGHDFAPGDIASVEAVTYQPVKQFGGWGVRFGRHGSRALNVSGNRGVEIVERGGRRWVIGSQRPEELAAAVAALGVPSSD